MLRQPGTLDEAYPARPDGARLPRREAQRAPHRARVGAAASDCGRGPGECAEARRESQAGCRGEGEDSAGEETGCAREEGVCGQEKVRKSEERKRNRGHCGSESTSVWIPARLQQDVEVALVRRSRLREAAPRGPGAS